MHGGGADRAAPHRRSHRGGYRRTQNAGVTEPLNVIACENGVRATTQLREAVLKHLDEAQRDWCEQYVGFPDCSVDRIVPPVKSENPIDVVVRRFFEWNVERAAFKGAVPEIPGMNPADNLIAYIERKLFTLNTGHAIGLPGTNERLHDHLPEYLRRTYPYHH